MRLSNWLVILVLLAMVVPAVRGLDHDALWYDEIRSYQHAGGAQYGPKTLPQVWDALATNAPDQAPGYFLLLNIWGGTVGWTEFSVRALSLLAALLCVAIIYRTGTDLLSAWSGISAAVILASSAYFIQFSHEARAFMLGMFAFSLVLWSYWHITYRKPTLISMIGLMLGALGMLYAHYFIAVLLLVLAVYHLAFAPKTRRWWLPIGLALPVTLAFTPALLMLPAGIARNEANTRLQDLAMNAPQVGWALMHFFGNGVPLLALLLLIVGLVGALWRGDTAKRFIAFMAVGSVITVMLVNAQQQLIIPGRERYLAGLWVPTALLAGAGVHFIAQQRKTLAIALLTVWAALGIWATGDNNVVFVGESRELAWRDLRSTLDDHLSPSDVVAFHAPKFPWGTKVPFDHYMNALPVRAELLETLESTEVMQAYVANADRVWLGMDQRYPQEPQLATFKQTVEQSHMMCESWQLDPLTSLTLFATSAAYCQQESIAQFGSGIHLVSMIDPQIDDNTLQLSTHWAIAPDVQPDTFSAGIHILHEGELIAQQDVGLPRLPTLLLNTELDISELEPGTVQVTAIVYDWRTGERLPTPDAQTDDPTRFILSDVTLP